MACYTKYLKMHINTHNLCPLLASVILPINNSIQMIVSVFRVCTTCVLVWSEFDLSLHHVLTIYLGLTLCNQNWYNIAVHIEDCESWWLSGCCGSVAEHWQLKPEVSWVRLLAAAGFSHFFLFMPIIIVWSCIVISIYCHTKWSASLSSRLKIIMWGTLNKSAAQ